MDIGFDLLSPIREREVIAVGSSIRELARLRKAFGAGRWHKMKGLARVQLEDGRIGEAELHWYEAHGIGKRNMKVKYFFG
jgi:hypothetical protein